MTYLLAALLVIAIASAYHGITEHHWLRKLARIVQHDIFVPQARHDSPWHGMGHGKRAGIMTLLAAAAVLAGWAWQSRPEVAAVTIAFTVIAAAALPAAHTLTRTLGSRRPAQYRNRYGSRRREN